MSPARSLSAAFAVLVTVAATGEARAQLAEVFKSGRWNGGAIAREGAVTQCVLASRFKGAAGPTDARTYAVLQSVSRAAGLAIAVQDKTWRLEPGRAVPVKLAIDGQDLAGVEGKAVSADVVAIYPADAAALKAALSGATSVIATIENVPYGYPADGSREVMDWLAGCANRNGFAASGFEKGRAEEERKLGQ